MMTVLELKKILEKYPEDCIVDFVYSCDEQRTEFGVIVKRHSHYLAISESNYRINKLIKINMDYLQGETFE